MRTTKVKINLLLFTTNDLLIDDFFLILTEIEVLENLVGLLSWIWLLRKPSAEMTRQEWKKIIPYNIEMIIGTDRISRCYKFVIFLNND